MEICFPPRWKFALERINNLPKSIFVGEESLESDVIKEVTEIIYKVKASPKLVGISPPLHQMDNLLDLGSNDIRFIGIVGLGGIGKTTIAKVLYEKLEHKFRYCCFLRDFDQKLVSIQKKLLLRLCGKFDIVIKNEDHGAKLIKKCLRNKKVLIVLDGVDERRQIEKLVGSSQDWFSPGSRIIITTRNRNLCCQPKYKHKMLEYNVEFLDHHNAFSLFCNHAFGENHEPLDENFRYLAEEMVKMVEGHPLALIKIGSHLHGKDIDKWEESLEKVHKLLYKYLFCEVFRTSYEELDDESQQVFLDLACFFNNGMSMDRAIEILESFGYRSPYNKLNLLTQRNLIQVSHGMVQMHTLVHCMGRGIVQGERETQSRIWLRKHIRHMFGKEKGLEDVEGIVVMDMEEEELVLDAKSFAYMNKLKLLEINNVRVDEDIQFLSNKLGILRWNGYPSKYLPSTFQPQSLLELHLPNSKVVRLWEGRKEFIWLKEIDVSGSENLVETPDFSKLPNLQRLILRNCARLCVIHPSITTLNPLVLVDMSNCVNLKTFPSKLITCKRLQTLVLSNSGLKSFPKVEKPTKSLTQLHLDGTLIQDLPSSFGLLTHLTLLNLRDCTKLSSLPTSICKLILLQTLNLNGCKNLHQIPFTLGTIQSLTMLDIGGTFIDQAPDAIICLRSLETLNCERLSRNIWWSLSNLVGSTNGLLPIRDLNLSDCNLVDEDIPDDIKCLYLLEILDLSKNSFVRLKQSLTQLTNLKALYLNDCFNIQPQLLPKLPTSLQYVGGQNSKVLMKAN
ncbi:TMV resistance protein N-like [Cucumis melo]|uniref:TMV resistance protein N-like n=1 Tax=Cucumis melo TaxID=3656 RepID=A0A1S3CPB4_CUCME|nr:TMV resistance protein N-like [Cucumis melo]